MSTKLRFLATASAIILTVGVWIPASYAQNRTIQILPAGETSGAFLGIRMTDVTQENMSEYKLDSVQGVIVEFVVEGSPAESAGLREKDVILEFDGLKVRSIIQFSRLVKETPVGRGVEMLISRAGKRENLTAKLGDQGGRRIASGSGTGEALPAPFYGPGDPGFNYRIPAPPEWIQPRAPHMLGITIQALTGQLASYLGVPGKNGVLVTSVMEESTSAGKLQAGDVIVRADGNAVDSPQGLTMILQRTSGDTISLDVIRDKKEIKVVVGLSDVEGKEDGNGKGFKL